MRALRRNGVRGSCKSFGESQVGGESGWGRLKLGGLACVVLYIQQPSSFRRQLVKERAERRRVVRLHSRPPSGSTANRV